MNEAQPRPLRNTPSILGGEYGVKSEHVEQAWPAREESG